MKCFGACRKEELIPHMKEQNEASSNRVRKSLQPKDDCDAAWHGAEWQTHDAMTQGGWSSQLTSLVLAFPALLCRRKMTIQEQKKNREKEKKKTERAVAA